MGRVTIRDVAAAAGVSVSCVSYILNESTAKKYSEKTVKAVKRAAEQLGYSPNRVARNMRMQRANAIGIVSFWETGSAELLPTLKAVTEAATALGNIAVMCPGAEDMSYINAYKNRTVDGFVLIAPSATQYNERAHIRALQEAGAPFAIVNATLQLPGVATVIYDYYAVTAAAVRHLLELGRRRVIYVDEFSQEAARELRERREGYMDTVRAFGLLPRTCDLSRLSLEELSGVEGVVAARAETARALMRRLLDEGIRFPAEFDLIAASADGGAVDLGVPLSATEFSYREAGEYAVRTVLGMLAPCPFTPSPRFVEGKTVRA